MYFTYRNTPSVVDCTIIRIAISAVHINEFWFIVEPLYSLDTLIERVSCSYALVTNAQNICFGSHTVTTIILVSLF